MINNKSKLDLSLFDKALIVLSAVGIIVTSYSLYNESLIRKIFFNQNISNEKIGNVFDIKNDVRRRVSRSLMWFDLNKSEALYEGDTIFTGKNSQANLQLNAGSKLTLSPNSLVVLKTKDDSISLDLKVGSFLATLKSGQKLNLLQNGKIAKLSVGKSGNVKIKKNKKGLLSIRGKQLQVNAKDVNHSTSGKGDELINIDENFKVTKEKIDISLVLPIESDVVWSPGRGVKFFKWKVNKKLKGSQYKIEVYKTENLKYRIWSKNVSAMKVEIPKFIKPGSYYWRVSQGKRKKNKSFVGKFLVISSNPLSLISPKSNEYLANLKSKSAEPSLTAVFKWEARKLISKYKIQVSSTEDFSDVFLEKVVGKPSASIEFNEFGSHFWRVSIDNPKLEPESWSKVRTIYVGGSAEENGVTEYQWPPEYTYDLSHEEVKVEKQTFEIKAENSNTEFVLTFSKKNLRSPAAAAKYIKNAPSFDWGKVKGATEYSIVIKEIAGNKRFSYQSKVNNFVWKQAQPGKYTWKVAPASFGQRVAAFSDPQKINVSIEAPRIKKEHIVTKKFSSFKKLKSKGLVKIKWQGEPYTKSYKVLLSDSSNFDMSHEMLVKSSYKKVSVLPNKDYFVKVQSVGKKGRSISSVSSVSKVRFNKKLTIKSPNLLFPSDGITLVSFGGNEPILFSWDSRLKGAKYELQLAEDIQFKEVTLTKKLSQRSFVCSDELSGKVYWRVRTIKAGSESVWSRPFSFEK